MCNVKLIKVPEHECNLSRFCLVIDYWGLSADLIHEYTVTVNDPTDNTPDISLIVLSNKSRDQSLKF